MTTPPRNVNVCRKQMQIATSVMDRALRAEGPVTVYRAARVYTAALSRWRKAIVSAAAPPRAADTRHVA